MRRVSARLAVFVAVAVVGLAAAAMPFVMPMVGVAANDAAGMFGGGDIRQGHGGRYRREEASLERKARQAEREPWFVGPPTPMWARERSAATATRDQIRP